MLLEIVREESLLVILPTGLAKCPFKIELRGQISF
jgi:hypothetical protein